MNNAGQQSLLFRLLAITGGVALFGAVIVEMVAIIGRLIGSPLPGSIELVQVLVTLAGTTGLIVATLCHSHAAVRLITGRLQGGVAANVGRLNNLLSMIFFILLFAGSVWIAAELWSASEETEIWRIPYKPLRILVVAGTLCVAFIFMMRLNDGGKS